MAKKPIKVEYHKLGRWKSNGEPVTGLAWTQDRVVHIRDDLQGIELLDTIIHEVMHIQNPKFGEYRVCGNATELAKILYDQGFRWVDLK